MLRADINSNKSDVISEVFWKMLLFHINKHLIYSQEIIRTSGFQ